MSDINLIIYIRFITSPPEEPPVVLVGFQGFKARPYIWLTVSAIISPWGMFDLTNMIAPAYLSIFITKLSSWGIKFSLAAHPIF